jgi:hypothetical protein
MPNKELDVNYTFRGKTYQTSYGDIWEIAGRPEFVEVI